MFTSVFSGLLSSGVSLATSNLLAYVMLVLVAVFLAGSAAAAYIFFKKKKRETRQPTASPA